MSGVVTADAVRESYTLVNKSIALKGNLTHTIV